jgi:hypothetical protein
MRFGSLWDRDKLIPITEWLLSTFLRYERKIWELFFRYEFDPINWLITLLVIPLSCTIYINNTVFADLWDPIEPDLPVPNYLFMPDLCIKFIHLFLSFAYCYHLLIVS